MVKRVYTNVGANWANTAAYFSVFAHATFYKPDRSQIAHS